MFIVENLENAQHKEKKEKYFKTHILEIITVGQFIRRHIFLILCMFIF